MAIALDTLVYARRLREAGFSEQQAEGQAEALAAAMTESLATKQDLRESQVTMEARFLSSDARFEYSTRRMDMRLDEFERRVEIRFQEQTALFQASLADLERRMTLRLGGITVAGIGVVSALVKVL